MTTQPSARRAPRHPWIIVAKREILTQIQSKAFWVGTLMTLGLVAVVFLVSGFLSNGQGSTKVAVATDGAAAVLAQAKATGTNVEPVKVAADQLDQTVRSGDAEAALSYSESGGWALTVKDPTSTPDLTAAVRDYQIGQNSAAAGVNAKQILTNTTVQVVPLDATESNAVAIVLATFAFSILFMLSAVTYGMQIAQSVVTEKESRIVEILAAAVPTRSLLIGKVVGNTIMALSQVVLLVGAALIGLSFTPYKEMIGMVAPVAGWFILFFLVGFASLACLWAAAGAMATRVQDLSQTTTPLTMIVMLVYMAGMFAKGSIAQILSYVPIASTVMMPGRLLNGTATWVDAIIALVIALGFMALMIWVGVRIYRRGLLQTGSVMSYKQVFSKAS